MRVEVFRRRQYLHHRMVGRRALLEEVERRIAAKLRRDSRRLAKLVLRARSEVALEAHLETRLERPEVERLAVPQRRGVPDRDVLDRHNGNNTGAVHGHNPLVLNLFFFHEKTNFVVLACWVPIEIQMFNENKTYKTLSINKQNSLRKILFHVFPPVLSHL